MSTFGTVTTTQQHNPNKSFEVRWDPFFLASHKCRLILCEWVISELLDSDDSDVGFRV
jgi:hypothetical protein